jgi:LysM repeat protein
MEDETPKKRNIRPEETSRLPLITLITLLVIIAALFMIGYKYITDDTQGSEEVTDIVPDTTSKLTNLERSVDPLLAEPDQIDTVRPIVEGTDGSVEETAPPVQPTPAPAPEKKPEPKPVDVGGTEVTHTVQSGDTFFGIANRYNLSVETLKALNPQIKDVTTDLKSGVTKLNIRVQAVHTVGPGDVLRVVANKYKISKQLLMQANGKTRDYAQRGEKLIVPFGKKR